MLFRSRRRRLAIDFAEVAPQAARDRFRRCRLRRSVDGAERALSARARRTQPTTCSPRCSRRDRGCGAVAVGDALDALAGGRAIRHLTAALRIAAALDAGVRREIARVILPAVRIAQTLDTSIEVSQYGVGGAHVVSEAHAEPLPEPPEPPEPPPPSSPSPSPSLLGVDALWLQQATMITSATNPQRMSPRSDSSSPIVDHRLSGNWELCKIRTSTFRLGSDRERVTAATTPPRAAAP